MARLTVEVEQDHLERLVRQPKTGLAELIWNALDADATTVDVEVDVNALDGIEAVRVIDDGEGMSPERIDQAFSHLGGSWKKMQPATELGRGMHGRSGEGRFAAFAIGESIRWTSTADRVTGDRVETSVSGSRSGLRDFDSSAPVPASQSGTGTVVEIRGLTQSAEKAFQREGVLEELTAAFALYLEQYPVSITWRGNQLDPTLLQAHRELVQLRVADFDLDLVIIEWKKPVKRALHLCDSTGTSLYEMAPSVQAPGFEFTAYLRWDGFRQAHSQLGLEDMAEEPIPSMVAAAREGLRTYFSRRMADKGTELVRSWKQDKSYPYDKEPVGAIERAERDLFEIMAVTAAPVIEDADQKSRRFSLRLLREAIEQSPDTVHELLQEVLELPEDRLEEFRDLVKKTSLKAIISAARHITDRLDFLDGLEQIVLDKDYRKHLLERRQLHRIVASETWIFGEEYALTADDNTLRTSLREHIALLGRDNLVPDDLDAPVVDETGSEGVVDLMISRVTEHRRNEREHIVIELKRPTVHIGPTQIAQIQTYASAVKSDKRFASVDTRWDFWIVGDEMTQAARDQAVQANRASGIITQSTDGKYVVRAVTWAQIIQDARHRLRFVREALDYASDGDRGLQYLRRVHGKFLPEQESRAE